MKASHLFNLLMAAILLFAAVAYVQPAAAQPTLKPGAEVGRDSLFVPGEVVVGFAKGQTADGYRASAANLAQAVKAEVVDQSGNVALLSFPVDADVNALAAQISAQRNVSFAEPNYIYGVPEYVQDSASPALQRQVVLRRVEASAETQGKNLVAIPVNALQAMRTRKNGRIQATYPNDPYLWWNGGWDWVGGSIVWPNATPSAGVCVLDTGVDYLHRDLGLATAGGVVVKGYDFVNGDADPMDDFGHGTHVAGIIAAKRNNAQGISGVSTGKVIAVKVLGSQGWGTNFDIAAGINYCANRPDVRVLNLSLGGGGASEYMWNALNYAVNTKGKLVVVAAGNNGEGDPYFFPARFSNTAEYPEFANKVLSVAASGQTYEDPPGSGEWYVDYNCKAWYSNYASWVSISAPGTWIYSTTPWDKPFYMNWYYDIDIRYAGMDGTSMATPFVAAAAARRWGYKPLETNNQIAQDLMALTPIGTWDYGDGSCWPAVMDGKSQVDVAALLERGAASSNIYDASAGTPLDGAALKMYQAGTLRGTGIVTADHWGPYPWEQDPTRVYTGFNSWVDVLNLPIGGSYTGKVNKAGYTTSDQPALQHALNSYVEPGLWSWLGPALVPPKSTNFDTVIGWWWVWRDDTSIGSTNISDLDLDVWLPNAPNQLDPSQPAPFIVGLEGNSFGFLEGDPSGAMTAFPYARYKREGGWVDWLQTENTTIASRKAHGPLAANAALPYYPGTYTIMVTDYGQTIDHDGDPGTPPIPVMGVFQVPWLYIWKDGQVKLFTQMNFQNPGDSCNAHWWKAATITSGVGGAVSYAPVGTCGDGTIVPYVGSPVSGLSR